MLEPFYNKNNNFEVGVDESGAGPLVGPVFAAAVVWNNDSPLLRDSKKLTPKKRQELEIYIKENAFEYAVAYVDEKEIDKINILNARIKAMNKAIGKLKCIDFIDLILVDGNRFNSYEDIPYVTIVKGDDKYQSISAASILAKEEHDRYMLKIAKECPEYNWEKNKGYPTKDHKERIKQYGLSKYHRKTFKCT